MTHPMTHRELFLLTVLTSAAVYAFLAHTYWRLFAAGIAS